MKQFSSPFIRASGTVALLLCATLFTHGAQAGGADVGGRTLADDKPIANAVVWLEAPNAPAPRQHDRVVMDQRNLTFYPHVLAIRVGTTVDFPNNDRVFHNIFSYRDGKRFDLGLYPVGSVKRLTFENPGLSRLFCNIHPKMAAYILALDTPYFAVSDRHGRFGIRNVPPGKYVYRAWRPGAEEISGSVSLRPGSEMEVRWP